MLKKLINLLPIALIFCLTGCAILDIPTATQTEISGEMRLVSTSVAICRILDELGYNNVIGVPDTGDYKMPERYSAATTVGMPMTPDYEIIKSLSPDIVLSPKALEDSLASEYTAAEINSAFLDMSSVGGMYTAINSLGKLIDRENEAKALVEDYEKTKDLYNTHEKNSKNLLLLMSFPDGFYLVSSENSYVGNLVELAGGKNVYSKDYVDDENGFININPEDMVQKAPDMILVFAHYSEDSAFEYMRNEFETNGAWQHYDAVKNGNIRYLPSKYFGMSATLDWKEALEFLKPILNGDE